MNNNNQEKQYYRDRRNHRFYVLYGENMVVEMINTFDDETELPTKPEVGIRQYQADKKTQKALQNGITKKDLLKVHEKDARQFKHALRARMQTSLREAQV